MEKEEGRKKLENIHNQNTKGPQSIEQTLQLMNQDEYHKRNPENTLGTKYKTTNAYGKKVVGYKGNIETILRNARLDLANFKIEETEALDTVIDHSIEEITQSETAIKNIKNVLKKRIDRKVTTKSEHSENPDLYSFNEVIENYNAELSSEEIKAWIWYKRFKRQFIDEVKILDRHNGWSTYVTPLSDTENLNRWLKEGVMAYYQGSYLPSVLYYAENIYLKQTELEPIWKRTLFQSIK